MYPDRYHPAHEAQHVLLLKSQPKSNSASSGTAGLVSISRINEYRTTSLSAQGLSSAAPYIFLGNSSHSSLTLPINIIVSLVRPCRHHHFHNPSHGALNGIHELTPALNFLTTGGVLARGGFMASAGSSV